MTFEELLALSPGDVIEAGRLLPVVTSEPMTHTVISVDPEKKLVLLETKFFGVMIGALHARPTENGQVEYKAVFST